MSNGNLDRMWKLWTKLAMLVLDGKRSADTVCEKLQEILAEKVFIREIYSEKEISQTTGLEELTNVDFFWIDPKYKKLGLDSKWQATDKIKTRVFESLINGHFKEIIERFGESLDHMTFTFPQVIMFFKEYNDPLDDKGEGNFFLIKRDGQFFGVYIGHHRSGWYLTIEESPLALAWQVGSRYRLIVPQQ